MVRLGLRLEFTSRSIDEASVVLRSLVGPVRAEPGCDATRVLRDLDDAAALTFVEEWRDRESLDRHLRGTSFRTILALMELATGPPLVEIDEIASRRGFDLVEDVLGRIPPERTTGGLAGGVM